MWCTLLSHQTDGPLQREVQRLVCIFLMRVEPKYFSRAIIHPLDKGLSQLLSLLMDNTSQPDKMMKEAVSLPESSCLVAIAVNRSGDTRWGTLFGLSPSQVMDNMWLRGVGTTPVKSACLVEKVEPHYGTLVQD
jgi:hypothetical protein